MASTETSIHQAIFKTAHPPIDVQHCHESELSTNLLSFLLNLDGTAIGLAASYGAKCCLTSLAISSPTRTIVISMAKEKGRSKAKGKKPPSPHIATLQRILADDRFSKYAFHLDTLATALYSDHQLRVTHGKDLLTVSKQSRDSVGATMDALGGATTLDRAAVLRVFHQEDSRKINSSMVALQAWAACRAATLPQLLSRLEEVPVIDTVNMDEQSLKVVSKTIRDAARLVALKPVRVKNDIDNKHILKGGNLKVTSQRYKTRVMRTEKNQFCEVRTRESDGSSRVLKGDVPTTKGKSATISLKANIGNSKIQSLTTVGRERATNIEVMRGTLMLNALQLRISFSENPFISSIWLPGRKAAWQAIPQYSTLPKINFPGGRVLNESQAKAVTAILSNKDKKDRVVLIHGPPGTGKTTVIAASVTSVISSGDGSRTMWLVAHSNVAVKNMAEKLASVGFFDFKILVSKEFHYEWHEHLYTRINQNVIRSDDFAQDLVGAERRLLGARVILCTLSMLSNDKMDMFARLVPLQTVIFDEASQIEIGDYFPMMVRFWPTLRKLVFIGDDKQLAPYGTSDIPELESIFEKAHLRGRAIFLDTQYRMPIAIGSFISEHVYGGKLKSHHLIEDTSCCRFVNVSGGKESQKGYSFQNSREIAVAIKIASQLTRYKKSFRIITPYDPQRSMLEVALKTANLPWEDKCFNIDSFQGNEDDFIIISLVRSQKMGFLHEMRRVNVMLTRCKKGMIICTSRNFIQDQASKSLVGKLAKSLGPATWLESHQVEHEDVKPFI